MKIRSVAFVFLLCATPSLCKALAPTASSGQLIITEVMYDPAGTDYGHEWLEVYNAGTSSVTLPTYKVFEGGAKHNIVAVGNTTLAPQTYAVIAQNAADFEKDYPDFSGELFHSAISFDNAGATIQIVDASSSIVASATYDSASGGLGNGNSLQRISENSAFVARAPSPGAPISSSIIPAKTKTASTKTSSTRTASTTKTQQGSTPTYARDTEQPSQDSVASTSQVAIAESATSGNSFVWWIVAAALALASAAALFFARRYKRGEWSVIEES